MRNTIIFVILLITLVSCSKPPIIIRDYPVGNLILIDSVNSPNTLENEVAPVQIQNYSVLMDFCERERRFLTDLPFEGIITSKEFIQRSFPITEYNREAIEYLTSNVESVTFLTSEEGFASFSHPPSNRYRRRYELPMVGAVGGTDIFSFRKSDGRYSFDVLLPPINSEFWDSHPFVINDSYGNILLIWASDRMDNRGGFSFPYYNSGNTDLYFAFKKPYESWEDVEVLNFNSVLDGINTKFNEASPFLFCKCFNPILFFASNRDSKDSTFDIFYVKLTIDFERKKIFANSNIEMLDRGENYINTTADERYPFIPYPHITNTGKDLKIYFASNRVQDTVKFQGYDSLQKRKYVRIYKNVGLYDIYQFNLDKQKFECKEPPPPEPPKLYLIVHVNRYNYNHLSEIVDSLIDFDTYYLFNGKRQKTKEKFQIEFGKDYKLEALVDEFGCDSCVAQKMDYKSPRITMSDSTIELSLNIYCFRRAPQKIRFSLQKGLAFFVTGYWYPTTTKNLQELWKRSAAGCLDLSRFIDSTDFRPDERYFYLAAAEINDLWFYNELVPTIDSLLQLLDTCYNNQKIVITVHGYTDPCPLRTIRDETGQIIQDYTKYSCDGDIEFNDIIIPTGTLMKFPDLKRKDGSRFVPPIGTQQGNYVLAMLRAYYTMQTIRDAFREKYGNNPGKMEKFEQFVKFSLDAFGIYDERPPCPNYDKDIVGVELANRPYPPTLNEPCNLPHSRRAMIFVDVVDDVLFARGFKRIECGAMRFAAVVEEKKEERKPKRVRKPEQVVQLEIQKDDYVEPEEVEIPSDEKPCVGLCYQIVFGQARNEAEFEILKTLITALGFEIMEPENGSFILKAKQKFHSYEEAKEVIDEYNKALRKLTGIIEIARIKAQIVAM